MPRARLAGRVSPAGIAAPTPGLPGVVMFGHTKKPDTCVPGFKAAV